MARYESCAQDTRSSDGGIGRSEGSFDVTHARLSSVSSELTVTPWTPAVQSEQRPSHQMSDRNGLRNPPTPRQGASSPLR